MTREEGFADALLAAPVGVSVLAALGEAGVDPDRLDLDAFLALAQHASYWRASPWLPDVPATLTAAYRAAPSRRALAEAVARRFGPALHADLDLDRQAWWVSGRDPQLPEVVRTGLPDVYCCGEFPWSALWTATDAIPEVQDWQLVIWEVEPSPSRWRLPLRRTVRVHRIDRPDDWVALVRRYPSASRRSHSGWELTGPNPLHDGGQLEAASAGRAARSHVGRVVMPDWAAVAREVDGVHLSWAGFLTTEGRVLDLADGDVTMLRYWGSERTLWLRDVLDGEPEPLPPPALPDARDWAADPSVEPRRGHDLAVLRGWMRRLS